MDQQATFGFPEEWEAFHKRHEKFLSEYPIFQAALDRAFLITINAPTPADKVIFGVGRLCAEDFLEILLLCGNGYGIAALKLLRGLFERAVTIAYLHQHPEESLAFINYYFIRQHKLYKKLESLGKEIAIPREERENVEKEYQALKQTYLVTDCKKCNTQRVNHNWNKLDIVSMANQTPLADLVAQSYYLPLSHAHSTAFSLMHRIDFLPSGGVTFKPESQPRDADIALISAHRIMLHVLDVENQHFQPEGLQGALGNATQSYENTWREYIQKNQNVATED